MDNDKAEIHVDPLPFQQIPNWVFESDVSATAIKLYLVLRKNGDNKRGTSFWSRRKLAEQLGTSTNTMDRAKKELIEMGALCQINRKNKDGDWTSNLYHLHTSSITNCKYLFSPVGRPIPTSGDTPIPTSGELTNNHI
jgi:DNA-binding transcriptional MocR family regulator